jgi:predicted dehydrogenase
MIRLALIGSPQDAQAYAAIANRMGKAVFVAYAPSIDGDTVVGRQALGVALSAASAELLLDQHASAFDALLIHAELGRKMALSQQAARVGKHVLANAPLAASLHQAEEVINQFSQSRAGIRLVVGRPWRFLPSLQSVKASLNTGKLGTPGLLRVHCWKPLDRDPREVSQNLLERIYPEIDHSHWIFNSRPNRIFALSRPSNDASASVTYLQVHLGFPQGGMALIDYAWALPEGADYYSLSLIGSKGAAYADDHHNMNLLFAGGNPAALRTDQGIGHFLPQIQHFVDTIVSEKRPIAENVADLAVFRTAEAVLQAAQSKKIVELTPGSNHPKAI